jgi:hypothetical protein
MVGGSSRGSIAEFAYRLWLGHEASETPRIIIIRARGAENGPSKLGAAPELAGKRATRLRPPDRRPPPTTTGGPANACRVFRSFDPSDSRTGPASLRLGSNTHNANACARMTDRVGCACAPNTQRACASPIETRRDAHCLGTTSKPTHAHAAWRPRCAQGLSSLSIHTSCAFVCAHLDRRSDAMPRCVAATCPTFSVIRAGSACRVYCLRCSRVPTRSR